MNTDSPIECREVFKAWWEQSAPNGTMRDSAWAAWQAAWNARTPSGDGLVEKLEAVYAPNAGAESVKRSFIAIVKQHFSSMGADAPEQTNRRGYPTLSSGAAPANPCETLLPKPPENLVKACIAEVERLASLKPDEIPKDKDVGLFDILDMSLTLVAALKAPVPVSVDAMAALRASDALIRNIRHRDARWHDDEMVQQVLTENRRFIEGPHVE